MTYFVNIDYFALRRTEFFPGLGWLLTRSLYEGELERAWPNEHWDHWLRSESISRHREIVYPQVPRSFHNGVVGTFMNLETHNRYFRDIAYNQNPDLEWAALSYIQGTTEVYEARLVDLIEQCTHVQSLQELKSGGEGILFCTEHLNYHSFLMLISVRKSVLYLDRCQPRTWIQWYYPYN